MKRLFTLIVLLLGTWLSSFAANIPAGQTLYLYVSPYWSCYASYLFMTSHDNNKYEVMEAVQGQPGLYKFTFTSEFRWKLYFGASNEIMTQGGHEWIANITDIHTQQEINLNWTATNNCYIIDDITGSGHWGPIPSNSGSASDATIDSVRYEIVSSCVTETYNITVHAYFQGEACSYKLTGSKFTRDIVRSNPVSPVSYTLKNLPALETPVQETITFALCSDGAGAADIVSETVTYTSPTLDCEVLHDPIVTCIGFPDIVLEASMDGDSYLWSTGATTKSISVSSNTSATYSVEVYSITHSAIDNLMANGDFETVPSGSAHPEGFTSSYNYVGTFDPHNYYSSHGGADNLYSITHNANYFWRDFADIEPHGGNYYAIFDAGRSGYAWKATTVDNTSLTVQKDSIYLFSYWAAYPNVNPNNSPAILQFRISYTNPQGQTITENLGQPYELGQEADLNAWYYQEIQWQAPCNSSEVTISVEDLNSDHSGNDFCLDDILFQRTTVGRSVLAKKDIYPVEAQECDALMDTICLGERYNENGFDVTPTEAGPHTYTSSTSQTVLSLFVTAPIQATFTQPGTFCNYGGDDITLPFTVQSGIPVTYSLSSTNPLINQTTDAPLSGYSIPLSAQDSIFEATTIHITLKDEFGFCDPFTTDLTLNFRRCDYLMDTVCTGEPYDKDGFSHPADQAGTYTLVKDPDTLLLTVIESIDITIQPPAPLCNVSVDTTLTVQYTINSGSPSTYSLHFDNPLIEDVEEASMQGNQFSILVPAEIEEAVQVTFYTEEATGHCAYEKIFSIGRNAGASIYRKWDDVLFVDNGEGLYVGYQWYCDGVAINGATRQDYYTGQPLENDGHEYHVVMTRADGTTDLTCPMRFGEAEPSAQHNPGDRQPVPFRVRHYMIGAHVDIIETVYDDGSTNIQKQIVP